MLAVEPVADTPSATPAGEDAPLREARLTRPAAGRLMLPVLLRTLSRIGAAGRPSAGRRGARRGRGHLLAMARRRELAAASASRSVGATRRPAAGYAAAVDVSSVSSPVAAAQQATGGCSCRCSRRRGSPRRTRPRRRRCARRSSPRRRGYLGDFSAISQLYLGRRSSPRWRTAVA